MYYLMYIFTISLSLQYVFTIRGKKYHTPAVMEQKTEKEEQDEGHATQNGQKEHSVVGADVLCNHRTCNTRTHTQYIKKEHFRPCSEQQRTQQ